MNTPKLRVIQSKSNGFVSQLGDLCYSGIKSFTDTNPRESRLTLFILNNEDGTTDASIFESVWSGEKNNEGQHIFVTVTTPVTVRNVNTKVHLMSSLSDKMELVNSIIWVTHREDTVPLFFCAWQFDSIMVKWGCYVISRSGPIRYKGTPPNIKK